MRHLRILAYSVGQMTPPPPGVCEFVSKILCARENDQVFYKKQCVGGIKCE